MKAEPIKKMDKYTRGSIAAGQMPRKMRNGRKPTRALTAIRATGRTKI